MAVDPVHRLEIIEAVRVTKARYFRFIDQKRWDEFPALFVDGRPHRHHRRLASHRVSIRAAASRRARTSSSRKSPRMLDGRADRAPRPHAGDRCRRRRRMRPRSPRCSIACSSPTGACSGLRPLRGGVPPRRRCVAHRPPDLAPPAHRRRALSHVSSGYSDFRAMPSSARAAVSSFGCEHRHLERDVVQRAGERERRFVVVAHREATVVADREARAADLPPEREVVRELAAADLAAVDRAGCRCARRRSRV